MTELLKFCKTEQDIRKIATELIGDIDPFFKDAEITFLSSIIGLLVEGEKDVNDLHIPPYVQQNSVMGNTLYKTIDANIYELIKLAMQKWTEDCGICLCYVQLMNPDLLLKIDRNDAKNMLQLDIIFENLRHIKLMEQRFESKKMELPYCLRMWDEFKSLSEKTRESVILNVNTKLAKHPLMEIDEENRKDLTWESPIETEFGFCEFIEGGLKRVSGN